MDYNVRVRVQGVPANGEDSVSLTVNTEGELHVERGSYVLRYVQYEGEAADIPVMTRISLNRETVTLERSDHTTMVFDRSRPSFHPMMVSSGRTVSLVVVPHRVEWHQRKGKGSLRLSYELVYEGRMASNHDILFEFTPA